MHLWDYRRFAHFGLLIVMIVGIRACGGATQAEDRLSFATRWAADKAGLSGAKDTIDSSVKPRMAAATQSMTYSIFAATNRMMDSAESAVSGMATWAGQQASNAETAVVRRIRSILGTADPGNEPPPRDGSPTDTDRATESSR
jgi:hypothetical protein